MKEKIAVIADIHGNSFALETVLQDISRRGIETIFNLGDSLYGPLDPLGTVQRLTESNMVHVTGNCDRMLFEANFESSPTLEYVKSVLTKEHIDWRAYEQLTRCRRKPQLRSMMRQDQLI